MKFSIEHGQKLENECQATEAVNKNWSTAAQHVWHGTSKSEQEKMVIWLCMAKNNGNDMVYDSEQRKSY